MSVYLIGKIDIHDPDGYRQYEAGFMEIFSRYHGRLLSVEESPKVLEGAWQTTRTVLIEFPSEQDAMAWYQSDDYRALAQHRTAASHADIALINGLAGVAD